MTVPLLSHLDSRYTVLVECFRDLGSSHPVLSSITQHPDENGLMSQSLGLRKGLEARRLWSHPVLLLLTSWGGEKDAEILATQDRMYILSWNLKTRMNAWKERVLSLVQEDPQNEFLMQ